MAAFTPLDLAALAWFVLAWIAYSLALEKTVYGRSGLNALLNRYREIWMEQMLGRDMRMVDGQVTASLQNGTAFFASTSLIAIGGVLTVMRSSEEVFALAPTLPFGIATTREQWELKVIGLAVIFVYAFFKFAWSYRLFNYVAILIGAAPSHEEKDTPAAKAYARRTALLAGEAGLHFNRGQRAFFFALGYLGWFIGPLVLIATTAGVVAVMWRRQFASASRRAFLAAAAGPGGAD